MRVLLGKWVRLGLAGGFVAALFCLLWLALNPKTTSDRIALLNLLIVFATAITVGWYSWETRKLRQITQSQTRLSVRPFLTLRYVHEERKLWLHNIGKGVAREVRVHNVSLTRQPDAENYVTVEWRSIDFIPEGEKRELVGEGQLVTREEKQAISTRLRTWMSNFGRHGRAEYEFVVDYRDLTGQPYRAAFEVSRGETTLLRDAPWEED